MVSSGADDSIPNKLLPVLTHIQLPHKACHIIVLEIFGKNFFCKSLFIQNQKTLAILKKERKSQLAEVLLGDTI